MMTDSNHQTLIHRLGAGCKLAIIFIVSLVLFMIPHWSGLLAVLVVVYSLFIVAGLGFFEPVRQLAKIWWLFVLLFLFQYLYAGWQSGLVLILRSASMILLAALVTSTTPVSVMMETLQRLFGFLPLPRSMGAHLALMLTLSIRFIPMMSEMAAQVREAQKARGLEKNILALMVPLMIRMLKMSSDIADAIEVRCYGIEDKKTTKGNGS